MHFVRCFDSMKKKNVIRRFYARTLVFVQSSGMGKSRLADAFGQNCPMINFVLRNDDKGYPPSDVEILQFMLCPPPVYLSGMLHESPEKTTILWNHSIAVGLLQASFEICKLHEPIPRKLH